MWMIFVFDTIVILVTNWSIQALVMPIYMYTVQLLKKT